MEKERGSGENEGENGHAAERNPHADHALAAHRLEHEEAENPVHEIEKADDVVGRGEAQGGFESGGLRGELGEQERGQTDEAAPQHPTQSLVVVRLVVLLSHDENRDGANCDCGPPSAARALLHAATSSSGCTTRNRSGATIARPQSRSGMSKSRSRVMVRLRSVGGGRW